MNKISGTAAWSLRSSLAAPLGFFSSWQVAPGPSASSHQRLGLWHPRRFLLYVLGWFWGKGGCLKLLSREGDAGGFTGLGFVVLEGTELDPSSLQSQVRAGLGGSAPLQLIRFYRFHNSRLGFIYFVNEFCKIPRNVAGQVPALHPWQQSVPLSALLRAARRTQVGKKGAGGTEGTQDLSFPSCRDSRSLCRGVAAGPSPLLVSPGEQ